MVIGLTDVFLILCLRYLFERCLISLMFYVLCLCACKLFVDLS